MPKFVKQTLKKQYGAKMQRKQVAKLSATSAARVRAKANRLLKG